MEAGSGNREGRVSLTHARTAVSSPMRKGRGKFQTMPSAGGSWAPSPPGRESNLSWKRAGATAPVTERLGFQKSPLRAPTSRWRPPGLRPHTPWDPHTGAGRVASSSRPRARVWDRRAHTEDKKCESRKTQSSRYLIFQCDILTSVAEDAEKPAAVLCWRVVRWSSRCGWQRGGASER